MSSDPAPRLESTLECSTWVAKCSTAGWSLSAACSRASSARAISAVSGQDQRAYSRPGADLLVLTSNDGDRTVVSLIEMRGK